MTKNTKNLLFVLMSLGILVIVAYGYISIKKLDKFKIKEVESNIQDFIYDEAKDTFDLEGDEEDLDGEEAIDEDDDFEVYEEDGLWDNEDEATAENAISNEAKPDDELEELYDNKPKPEKIKTVAKPKIEIQFAPFTPPSTTKVSISNSEKFLVVVGSFKSRQNARKKNKVLEKAGINGEIVQLEGSSLHMVVAGRYSTEAEAEVLKNELTASHGLKAFVKELTQ
jgi:cell division septation protein DedD